MRAGFAEAISYFGSQLCGTSGTTSPYNVLDMFAIGGYFSYVASRLGISASASPPRGRGGCRSGSVRRPDPVQPRTNEWPMTHHDFLLAGLLVGFSIAVPIGPMSLLCIQRTLASGAGIGISAGLGAATVNIAYGAVILLGLDWLSPWMASGQRLLSALG